MNYIFMVLLVVVLVFMVQFYKHQTMFYFENFDSNRFLPDWREKQIVRKNEAILRQWNHKDYLFNTITSKFGKLNFSPHENPEGVYI